MPRHPPPAWTVATLLSLSLPPSSPLLHQGESLRADRRRKGHAPAHPPPARLPARPLPCCSKVWNAVDNQTRKGHTSIIHGKWEHEETIATASFAGE